MALKTNLFPIGKFPRKMFIGLQRSKRLTFKTFLIFVSIGVITLGNWNNARIMIQSVYSGVITNFTDRLEHTELAQIKVGANIHYIESLMGHAELIKVSTIDNKIDYRYYFRPKYVLALAVDHDRVVAFQVVPLAPNFQAEIPFITARLNDVAINKLIDFNGHFATDNFNATYYLEQHKLGREGLFYDLHIGYAEYGVTNHKPAYSMEFASLMNAIVMGDTNEQLKQIELIREMVIPNVFTVGTLSLEQASEMLLTRYEYAAFL